MKRLKLVHGGARAGAGRPAVPNRKVSLTIRIEPELLEVVTKLARLQDASVGRTIREAIRTAVLEATLSKEHAADFDTDDIAKLTEGV